MAATASVDERHLVRKVLVPATWATAKARADLRFAGQVLADNPSRSVQADVREPNESSEARCPAHRPPTHPPPSHVPPTAQADVRQAQRHHPSQQTFLGSTSRCAACLQT